MVNIQSPGALQFAEYSYSAALGAGLTFIPPAKTIVMSSQIQANQDLSVTIFGQDLVHGADMGANSRGWIGCIYCDGTDIGFKNENIGGLVLTLYGVSMA